MKTIGEIIKIVIISLLIIFNMPYRIEAQSVFQLNGRTILQNANNLYDITTADTLRIDQKNIFVEFKEGKVTPGKEKLTTTYSLVADNDYSNKSAPFKLPGNSNFVETMNNLSGESDIDKIYFGYFIKSGYAIKKSGNQNPGTQSYTYNGAGRYPDDQHLNTAITTWELALTSVIPGISTTGAAWDNTVGDPSVKVAIIGQGMVWSDPDFYVNDPIAYDFLDDDSDVTPEIPATDLIEIGTAVASIIAARTANLFGLCGIAGGYYSNGENLPPITLMTYRVLSNDYNEANSIAVLKSVREAIKGGARIIHLGISFQNYEDPIVEKAIYEAHEAGIVIFAPAGEGFSPTNGINWPARHPYVIGVSGTDINDHRGHWMENQQVWCNMGVDAEISLPAENVEVRDIYGPGSGSAFISTTNISSAMATGIAALMLSVNPCLTAEDVRAILRQSCEKVGGYNYNSEGWCPELGYGRVNANKAIELAKGMYTSTIEINTTWDSDRFSGNIVIKPGVTLTLNKMTLQMADEKSIVVEVGGKLIVNNSVITSVCNTVSHRWQGIKIEGNPSIWNANINLQGYAKIYNNSVIENARTAVDIVYNDDMGLISGGIVQAKNSTFLNNDLAFDFGEYGFRSGSSFYNCSFVLDQNYYGTISVNQPMVNLWGNNGVHFTGCSFKNKKTANKGIGIVAYGSGFSVEAACESGIVTSPCPENMLIHSTFENFDYGIRVLGSNGVTKIDKTIFLHNNRGAYFTSNNYGSLTDCRFDILENTPGSEHHGAYYEYCTGHHIENNLFISNPNTSGNVGLYLNNLGSYQNYIYRNTFNGLSRAAVAFGNNRAAGGNTGLCFKCNTFTSNGTDIDIVLPTSYFYPTSGIALYQGIPSEGNTSTNKDTLAAANTFTLNATNNVRNLSGNVTNYYIHGINQTSSKIFPDPTLFLNIYTNPNTYFNRTSICKSWINNGGGNISQLLASKNAAKVNAEVISVQLQNKVDGGSTENLTFDILGSVPSEAMELHNQLLSESPYLSDSVIKTAIDQETNVPNAMLRDILVENPQAAKSNEILNMLDDRYEPMPDYMKEEIEGGKVIIGGREQLEAKLAAWQQSEGLLFNQIVTAYLCDTINTNAVTELKTFLQSENTAQAGFLLSDMNLQQRNYSAAEQAITTMQENLNLNANQIQQAIDYHTLIAILQSFQSDRIQPNALDSLHAIPVFNLYQSGNNVVTAKARDMLVASGLLNYREPIKDSILLKSAEVIHIIPSSEGSNTNKNLRVFPNPAGTYTIVEYMLPASTSNTALIVYSVSGIEVLKQAVNRDRDQITIDLRGFKPGIYKVALVVGSKIIATQSLTISK
jgi:hypothetical protein